MYSSLGRRLLYLALAREDPEDCLARARNETEDICLAPAKEDPEDRMVALANDDPEGLDCFV